MTGICINPRTAIISPKSIFVALTMKLLTVILKPEVKAIKQPKAKVILAFQGEIHKLCGQNSCIQCTVTGQFHFFGIF